MISEKHPSTSYPAAKTQQVEGFTHPRKTSKFFNFRQPRHYVWAGENFAYSGPLVKFSILVQSIIPYFSDKQHFTVSNKLTPDK